MRRKGTLRAVFFAHFTLPFDPPGTLPALAGILAAGVAAQWLAWRLRVPSILLLLAMGLLLGPLTGLLDPGMLFGPLQSPMISLAVAIILFEGGLTLDMRELRALLTPVTGLVIGGVLITWGLIAWAASGILGFSDGLAILIGALLTVTGPTVVAPLLNHVRPTGECGPLLKWEGIVADVIGATLAVLVLGAISNSEGTLTLGGISLGLLKTFGAGLLVGTLCASFLILALRQRWIPDRLEVPVTLGLVLATYALGDSIQHEAGLLAVTLMGFLLANQRVVRVQHIAEFKETLTTLLLACLFIVLAAGIQPTELAQLDGATVLFVLALILVVRPAAAFLSLSTSKLPWQQKAFVAGVAPRGVVAIAVAALFASRLQGVLPDADRLVPTVFAVAAGTVLVYGLGAAPLARALNLASKDPGGVLLVGASAFAESLAQTLKQAGVPVVLVDSNPKRLSDARMAGITTAAADATSAHPAEHIPMGGLGHMLALTPNEEVNRLATQQFAEFFGRAEVYRLQDGRQDKDISAGRSLFPEGLTFPELARRMAAGETVRATELSEEFPLQAFMEHHGEAAVPLLLRRGGKRTIPLTRAAETSPEAQDTLFYLGPDPQQLSVHKKLDL